MGELSASFFLRLRAPGQAFLADSSFRLTVPRPLSCFMLCLSPQGTEAQLILKTGGNFKGIVINWLKTSGASWCDAVRYP